MNKPDVKETMAQIHISEKMQEEIIMNIQTRMENGNKRTQNWKKMMTVAAAVVLTAGVVSFPVQAVVKSVVKARMENIPKEEVQNSGDMIQGQEVLADGFTREYSDKEKEREKALWQEYENGRFPEKVISQVDNAEDVTEGMLCYIKTTGVFNLPAQEMTDEEILEIIDFQYKMSYAVEQTTDTQEKVDEVNRKERAALEEKVRAAGGISEEKAIEIARKAMEADLGERGKKLKLTINETYGWSSDLCVADWSEIKEEDKGGIAYSIGFNNAENGMDLEELLNYVCVVNAVDGGILEAYEIQGFSGGGIVYYEH